MRDQLQKEADRLGIPFTHETTDAELRSMIAARNNEVSGLEPLNPTVEQPECFGLMWAASTDETCTGCQVQKHCLARLAGETIPRLSIESGRPLSPPEIEEALGLPSESVQAALEFHSQILQKAPPEPVQQPPVPEPIAPPVEAVASPEQESEVKQKQKAQKAPKAAAKVKAAPKSRKKNGSLPKQEATQVLEGVADPQLAGSVSPVADPAQAHAGESATPVEAPAPLPRQKRKTGRNGKVKPAVKKAKRRSASSTSSRGAKKAPPKKAAKKAAPKKAAPKKAAPKRQASAVPKSPRRLEGQEPWGEHTYQRRWERERERCPAIAALKPGSKRSRVYKGVRYDLLCKQGYYLLTGTALPECEKVPENLPNNEKLPTLYSTVLRSTGGKQYPMLNADGTQAKGKFRLMTNWSAPRYWGLEAK